MIDYRSTSSNPTTSKMPEGFTPSPYSVVIGRAKECKQAMGNKRLRVLCSAHLSEYSNAANRSVKSRVVSDIVRMVQDACPVGAFVKKAGKGQSSEWVEVDDSTAREKIGYIFRDLLSDQYRSSSKSKAAKRQRDRQKQNAAAQSMHFTLLQERPIAVTSKIIQEAPYSFDDQVEEVFRNIDIVKSLPTLPCALAGRRQSDLAWIEEAMESNLFTY